MCDRDRAVICQACGHSSRGLRHRYYDKSKRRPILEDHVKCWCGCKKVKRKFEKWKRKHK